MQFSLFYHFNLYLKLYFLTLLDFNAFKFVFLDFAMLDKLFSFGMMVLLFGQRIVVIKMRSVLGVKYEEIIRCGNGGSVFA